MKKAVLVAMVAVFSVFAVGSVVIAAEGPDGKITINADAKKFPANKLNADGTKKKNPVTFNHKKHGELGCTVCHHTEKDLKAGGAAKSCFECHGADAKDKQLNSYDMIHNKENGKCIKCHNTDEKAKAAKAPTACKGCHGGE